MNAVRRVGVIVMVLFITMAPGPREVFMSMCISCVMTDSTSVEHRIAPRSMRATSASTICCMPSFKNFSCIYLAPATFKKFIFDLIFV